jgi:ubiquinone/menaquinone biosynthesis C-methylase UbiE
MKQKSIRLKNIKTRLRCPNCSDKMVQAGDNLYCKNCKISFPTVKGITVLIRTLDKHKKSESDYHSTVSPIYRKMHQLKSYRNTYYHRQALSKISQLNNNSTVIEVGCGTGYDASLLLENNLLVVATDISIGQLLEAKKWIIHRGLDNNILYYSIDAENIPFEDNTFNASLITAALHHLQRPVKALSEMKRCTAKNGIVTIAMEPNRYEGILLIGYLFSIIKKISLFLLGERRFKNPLARAKKLKEPTQERTFTRKELLSLVKEAGLQPENIKSIWFTCGLIHWFLTLLNKISKKNWYINRDIERFFVLIDEVLAHIPIINQFCCNWTVICRKR